MNSILAIQDYINKMLQSISGMKVLLLDKETTGMISLVFSQSQMLQKEVYLFERIDQPNRELMAHLKAVCFLRPTYENIAFLKEELREPKYGEYHLFFTNTVRTSYIEDFAQSDENEVVKQVQEFFGDFYAINEDFFTLNTANCLSSQLPTWPHSLDRICDGIGASLLAFKKKPSIRYHKKSELAQKVGQELTRRMQQEQELFYFKPRENPPVLLLLDRRDDPVTPLLSHWTYQSMVHELIGISNNRTNMSNVPGIKEDLKEIVLSPEQDTFYRQNMFENFGDLGVNIKTLVDQYQEKYQSNQNIQSIDDMKDFVANYPEFRKLAGDVSKHVALMGELSRLIEQSQLLDISELEQELACKHDHGAYRKVTELIENPETGGFEALKLALLWSLRYEDSSKVTSLMDMLSNKKLSREEIGIITTLTEYSSSEVRGGDLSGKNWVPSIKGAVGSWKKGLKGVTNIYTQHKPLLFTILNDLVKGKLKESMYPYIAGQPSEKPTDIIVFITGGATYEEAMIVAKFNEENPGTHVLLGSSNITSPKTFIDELQELRKLR